MRYKHLAMILRMQKLLMRSVLPLSGLPPIFITASCASINHGVDTPVCIVDYVSNGLQCSDRNGNKWFMDWKSADNMFCIPSDKLPEVLQ